VGARGGGPTTRAVVGAVGIEVEGVVGTEVGGDVGAGSTGSRLQRRCERAREEVATTSVGRGGGGVLGVAGRVVWAQRGRGIGDGARGGEDRQCKEEDGATRGLGTGIYMPHPFTPGASPPPGVKVLYSRCVLPTASKGFFGGPRNCSPPLLPGGLPTRE